ncbi:MAG: MATE family efflux transporter [Eubacteriales bacterium]|nr:MATE family efflux transporter [Eubacteriales bacterium]
MIRGDLREAGNDAYLITKNDDGTYTVEVTFDFRQYGDLSGLNLEVNNNGSKLLETNLNESKTSEDTSWNIIDGIGTLLTKMKEMLNDLAVRITGQQTTEAGYYIYQSEKKSNEECDACTVFEKKRRFRCRNGKRKFCRISLTKDAAKHKIRSETKKRGGCQMEPNTPLNNRFKINFTNRQLVSLIGPLLLEQLLAITVGLADSLMVSTVSDAAISAVSLVDAISNLMIYVFSAMATGGAAVAGQYIGRREQGNACRAGQQLIALLGVVSFSFVALLYLFKTWVLTTIFGSIEPDVMQQTNVYYSYVMASIPGIALYNGGAALFRTMERSDISLKVSLLMNAINVAGNAILIFGFGMDVAGVAIPTLVSRTVAAVVIVAMLFNKKLTLHLSDVRAFRPNRRMLRNIFYISIPSGVENGMFYLGRLVLFSLISTFGTPSIVANAIGNTLGNFHVCAGQAIDLGLTTVVSECVGAGDYCATRYYVKKVSKAAYAIMAAVNLLIIALLPLIMRVYDVSPEAERLAIAVALIHGVSSIFLWLPSFMFPTVLRAAGDAKFTMTVSMLTMWLVRVLFAYIFGKFMGYGVIGVWAAHAVLDWLVRSVIFYARYRGNKWTTKAIKD